MTPELQTPDLPWYLWLLGAVAWVLGMMLLAAIFGAFRR